MRLVCCMLRTTAVVDARLGGNEKAASESCLEHRLYTLRHTVTFNDTDMCRAGYLDFLEVLLINSIAHWSVIRYVDTATC